MTTDERIDLLVRLNDGDIRAAFSSMLDERDVLYRRAQAAETSLRELRTLLANGLRRADRHWREAAALEGFRSSEGGA